MSGARRSFRNGRVVLVGDERTLRDAADRVGVAQKRLVLLESSLPQSPELIGIVAAGTALAVGDRRAGKPSKKAGAAQLDYVDVAYRLSKATGSALVSGPVSKAAIAYSGAGEQRAFEATRSGFAIANRAPYAIMCFAAPEP